MKMQASPQLRKAAVLVASLDPTTADALLDQLAPNEADLVRRLVVELEEVDGEELHATIGQFLGRDEDFDDEPQPPPMPCEPASSREGPPFEFLQEASVEKLLQLLEGERPQTLAVVVSYLQPARAAQLLYELDPALQADVMRRLVDLEEAHPEILRVLERGLEERIARHVQTARRRAAGISALRNILDAADSRWQDRLQVSLTQHAPQLARLLPVAEEPSDKGGRRPASCASATAYSQRPEASPRFPMATEPICDEEPVATLEDLWQLSDAALAALLNAADPHVAILALAGAREDLVERLMNRLPLSTQNSLRAAWEQLGPTSLSDIESAQHELVRLALQPTLATQH